MSFYQQRERKKEREKEASPKSKKFQLDLEYRHKGGYMSDIQTFSKVEGCREASFSLFVGKKTKRLSLAVLTNSVFYSKIKPLSKSDLLFPLTVLCHLNISGLWSIFAIFTFAPWGIKTHVITHA